jgi:hypothetical protein
MSKKPTAFDLFNNDSIWGNQTAGNLTHEDILQKNWNNITANKQRWKDSDWRDQHLKKLAEGRTDSVEEQRKESVRNSVAHKKMMQERWDDPAFRKKIAEVNSRPRTNEEKEHLRQSYLGKKKPTETIVKRKDTYAARQTQNEKVNKQCRSIMTPDGVFHNFALASKHFNTTKNTILRRCKNTSPAFSQWYYIDNK